ncbi:MAG: RdgB/HAM1 family non-canonical purine NTP pyrophosphatase [Gammaproteobacteria bacterium]|nr:RdgB/HAM1 family non-canonical purine NTP pyrophosphatase [Gammaproteobacteria bacterium]
MSNSSSPSNKPSLQWIGQNTDWVLASSNPGKLSEFRYLLCDWGLTVTPQSDLSVPDADETGLSFVENAIIKARNACIHTGLPAIADDSGLEVDALNGEPGIYSARFAGKHGDNAMNNRLVLEKMASVPMANRNARYQCILVFMRHAKDPTPLICQASWEGLISTKEQGKNGFGYDPIFWLPEKGCTAAELDNDEKNTISHRARAMQLFLRALQMTNHQVDSKYHRVL